MKLKLLFNKNPRLTYIVGRYLIISEDSQFEDYLVCDLDERDKAYAELFVAAPEMLELLRAAQTFLNVAAGAEPLYNKINQLLTTLK